MDMYSQNINGSTNQYQPSGYEKTKLRKILLLVIGVLVAIAIIALIVHLSKPESQQSKYLKAATAAAKKQTPNAKVAELKVADGFAVSIVSDPTAEGQANSGNQTYFKLNKDGSMTQIASGSFFSTIDLLGFGIPLATQAKLTGHNLNQTQQYLADACGYSDGNVPGYNGFSGSFNPGDWQIDAGTLDGLEQALTAVISNKNVLAKTTDERIICVNATRQNSNANTDKQTYVSSFTLELQFITANGALTTHTFTFSLGPRQYRSYTLDGQNID
ncbi:MAG TPA: hypothetical protein VFK97_02460 [Candidatus Saccharimonadales bacterium]|nr:hypothetical protein [Candidatus Saccharimonadales bacterium]